METLQPVIDLLTGHHGKLAQLFAWMASLRLAMKPFNVALLGWFNRVVLYIHNTPEKDDDALLLRLMGSLPYRVFAGLVDTLATIKLPTAATLRAELDTVLVVGPIPSKTTTLLLIGSLAAAPLLAMTGCARFHSKITEFDSVSGDEKVTEVSAFTLFDSKSELAKMSSGQTDKSQRVAIGTLNQDAAAPTALVESMGAGVGAAMRAFAGAPPVPAPVIPSK